MYTGLLHTHKLVVVLFLLIYLVKTLLLLLGKEEALEKFSQKGKGPEMAISALFLLTGVAMLFQVGHISTYLTIKIVVVLASVPIAIIGFKKKNKGLAVLSLALLVTAYGLAEMSKKVEKKEVVVEGLSEGASAEYDQLKHGKAVFMAYCVECHGADGAKGASGAKNLTESTIPVEKAMEIINYGKNNMMKYEGILTQKEIEAVANYVMTLRK